jgi:hypothetical protein
MSTICPFPAAGKSEAPRDSRTQRVNAPQRLLSLLEWEGSGRNWAVNESPGAWSLGCMLTQSEGAFQVFGGAVILIARA